TFVGQGKSNGPVAGVEFENGPDGGAHLLALHVSGVTGNAQREKPDNRRDHYVISAGTARRLFLRHSADISLVKSLCQSEPSPAIGSLLTSTFRVRRWAFDVGRSTFSAFLPAFRLLSTFYFLLSTS